MSRSATPAWLDALATLLSPRGCASVAWIGTDATTPGDGWHQALPAQACVRVAGRGFDDGRGLLLRVGDADALYLRFDPGSNTDASATSAVRTLALAAWELHAPEPVAGTDPLRLDMHALRNALNSIGMSGAVLSSRALPDELRPFAQDLANAVSNGVAILERLSQRLPR